MSLGDTTPRVLRFGVFELDRRSGELRKEGLRVRLQEQPLRVLDALLAEPGEPVTREALRQRLWPDETFVDFDNGLNRAINRLRTALGDEADNPRFIETLERRGYRFIAPVGTPDAMAPVGEPGAKPLGPPSTAETGSPRPRGHRRALWLAGAVAVAVAALLIALGPVLRRAANPADHAAIRSLAVLPLANLTGDPAQDYFSDGMTDALITNLASWPALRVISRQSVMRYKGSAKPLPEIARELGVEGVVEGSVARSAGRVRITAQLIHAPTDRHLWAHTYERRLEDVLALQDEVSLAIAEEVRITVTTDRARPTRARAVNPDAYDAYLLGRHHWNERNPQSLEKAIGYFRSAIAKDPAFAPAHAGLALAYGPRLAYGDIPPGPWLAEMKAEALKALELDPSLGEARVALASTLGGGSWDWAAAEREYRLAVQRDPNSVVAHVWYAAHLHALGRFEEALAQQRQAMVLDPLDPAVNRVLARDLDATGQVDAALAQWNRTLELGPDQLRSHLPFALFLLEHGNADQGLGHLERARALRPDDSSVIAGLAIASAMRGRTDDAHRLLERLTAESARRYISPVIPAYAHAALGERDSTFALLEKAYAAKDPLLAPIQTLETQLGLRVPSGPAAALRADPRFADLVRRMGFPRRAAASSTSASVSSAPGS